MTFFLRNSVPDGAMKWSVSIVSQGLWSGTNLIVALALVRALPMVEFGWFGVALAIKQSFIMIAVALVITPMTLLAAKIIDREEKLKFLSEFLHPVLVSLVLGCILALGLSTILAISIFPLMLFVAGGVAVEIIRRTNFILGDIKTDIFGGILTLVGTIGAMIILSGQGRLDLNSGLCLVGLVNLAWVLQGVVPMWRPPPLSEYGKIFANCWTHGRWVLASNVLGYCYAQFATFMTLGVIGPSGVAVLELGRQCVSLTQVLLQGTANLWFPKISQSSVTLSPKKFLAEVCALTVYQTSIGILLLGMVLIGLPFLLPILVPGREEAYAASIPVAWIMAAAMIGQMLWQHPSFATFALGKPEYGFFNRLIATIIVIPAGYVLTIQFGVFGAAWVRVLGEFVIFGISVMTLLRAALGPKAYEKVFNFLDARKLYSVD